MGELLSLGAAVVWALAVILFRRSGESLSPFTLNVFRVTVSSLLFLLTLLLTGQSLFAPLPLVDYATLAASGIIAIAISDTLFHHALNRIGAGLTAIVDCLYSPMVVVLAWALIDERLSTARYAGMGLVVLAVFIAARHEPPPGLDGRRLALGVLWGVLAMGTLAFGIVIAKPVLERSPVLWATTVRQLASLLALAPLALTGKRRHQVAAAFRPGPGWRFSLPGTLLGSYAALLLWIGGMKYAQAGAAAVLNQTSTIYTLLFAAIFLGEKLTPRKVAAGALALAGILLVTFG
ncbi:MAG: DMT family transporter [Acidobacteriota bacterium]|nr:DMT family transporter [Acidobacteriota bacterium]